jgi:hypothetical protein
LAQLATAIDAEGFEVQPSDLGRIPEAAQDMWEEGSLLLSCRLPSLRPYQALFDIDPFAVRLSAPCDVIYYEPFYLVHTPGLFEGLQKDETLREHWAELQSREERAYRAEHAGRQNEDHRHSKQTTVQLPTHTQQGEAKEQCHNREKDKGQSHSH